MSYTFRPMPVWPHDETRPRRMAQFKSRGGFIDGRYRARARVDWNQTIRELEYEVRAVGGGDIVIGCGLSEYDLRQDGLPRANSRQPSHPGVEISFDSRYGRLTYATDVFLDWRDNVRAIAKGLEALRAVARWGVAKRGQQYAGFALLTAGPGQEALGRQLVARFGSLKEALRHTHPDTGDADMTVREFQAVRAYKATLPS